MCLESLRLSKRKKLRFSRLSQASCAFIYGKKVWSGRYAIYDLKVTFILLSMWLTGEVSLWFIRFYMKNRMFNMHISTHVHLFLTVRHPRKGHMTHKSCFNSWASSGLCWSSCVVIASLIVRSGVLFTSLFFLLNPPRKDLHRSKSTAVSLCIHRPVHTAFAADYWTSIVSNGKV